MKKYILECSAIRYRLICIEVKKLRREFAKANENKYPASSCKRNKNSSLLKPKNISAARSLGFNKTAVIDFFQNLENIYHKYNFNDDRNFNYDECISTGLSTQC